MKLRGKTLRGVTKAHARATEPFAAGALRPLDELCDENLMAAHFVEQEARA